MDHVWYITQHGGICFVNFGSHNISIITNFLLVISKINDDLSTSSIIYRGI